MNRYGVPLTPPRKVPYTARHEWHFSAHGYVAVLRASRGSQAMMAARRTPTGTLSVSNARELRVARNARRNARKRGTK